MILFEQLRVFKLFSSQHGRNESRKRFVTLMAGFPTVVVKRAHEGRAVCTSSNEVFINYTFTTAQWLVWISNFWKSNFKRPSLHQQH